MPFHKSFLFNSKEKHLFSNKNLVFRNLDNSELHNQIEDNNEQLEGQEITQLENLKNEISSLTIPATDLERGNSLFDVLSTSIASLNRSNDSGITNDVIAIEILDGLLDNGKLTLQQARSPWRDFDRLIIENGTFKLLKRERGNRRNLDADASYEEIVNVNLSTVQSDTLTRLFVESELESRTVREETREQTLEVRAEVEAETGTESARPRRRRGQLEDPTPQVVRSAPRRIQEQEGDSREQVQSLSTQSEILDAIDNITTLTSFNLPEDFRRSFNSRQFRSLMTSGRINNADELIRNLDALSVTTEQLEDTLGYGRRGNLDAGEDINASQFLQNTQFAGESLQQFLRTTLILEQITEKTPDQIAELNTRRETFQLINRTVEILSNLELREVSEVQDSINPDYISRFEIPRSLESELENLLGQSNERNLIGLIILTYGPLENLIANGTFSIQARGDRTDRRRNTYKITLNNLNGINQEALQRIIARAPQETSLFYGSTGSLTRTMSRLSEMSDLMEQIRTEQFGQLRPAPESASVSSDTVYQHLRYMFNIEDTGMLSRNRNRSLTQFDTLGRGDVRVRQSDYISQRLSDRQMYQYLLESCLNRGENGTELSLEQFQTRLATLIALGQQKIQLDPSLSREERANIINAGNNWSFDSSAPIDQNIITLVKYGIIAESNIDTIEAMPILDEAERAVSNTLQQQGVPRVEADRLAQASAGFMANFDAQRIINQSGIGIGANINIPIGARRHEDGTYELIVPDENGPITVSEPVNGRTTLTLGLGSALTLPEQSATSLGDVGFMIGVSTEISERTRFATSISIRPMSIAANAEISTEVGNNGFEIGLQAAAGTTFLGIPFASGGVFFGRGIEANMDSAINRVGENLSLTLRDIGPEVWRSINQGNQPDSELLQLANLIPGIETIAENYRSTNRNLDLNNAKIFIIRELANAIVNSGIEETRGIGFTVGVGLSTISGLSFGSIEFIIARQRFASVDQSQLESLGISGQEAIRNLQTSGGDLTTTVRIDGVDSTYDPVSGQYITTESTYNPDSAINFATADQAILTLNEVTNSNGLIFGSNPDGTFYFTLSDYSSNMARYGLNQTTDIFIDPSTGIQISPGQNGQFQIQFGSTPTALPPNDLNIIFQRVTNSHGRQSGTQSIISFSHGETPLTAESLYTSSNLNSYIHIDRNGRATERTNTTEFESSILWRERTGRIPEITLDGLRSYQESTVRLTNLLEGELGELSVDQESLQQLETFYEQVANDTEFLQSLARATTISIENGEIDLDSVNDIISSKWIEIFPDSPPPTLSGNDILAVAARLIPDTFRNLQSVRSESRVSEVVRVAEEVSTRYISELLQRPEYNDNNGVPFTSEEQTRITSIVSSLATAKAQALATQIVAGTAENADISNLDSIFTTAGLRRMGVEGFRNFLFSSKNLPQIIQGSQTDFDPSNADEALAIQFVSNLFEPAYEIPNDILNNIPQVRRILTSPTGVELLSTPVNVGNIEDQISLAALIYTPEQFAILGNLLEQLLEGHEITQLTAEQESILNHLLSTITDVRDGNGVVEVKKYNSEISAFTINATDRAGYMFLAECGNLTFYNNREWNTNLTTEGFRVNSGSGESLSTTDYDVNARTMRLGLSAPFRGRQGGNEPLKPGDPGEPPSDDEPPPPPPTETYKPGEGGAFRRD